MNLTISKKIYLGLFLIILFTVIIISSISFYEGSRIIEERVNSQLKSVISLKENQLNDFIFEEKGDLESIANDGYFINIFNDMIQFNVSPNEHFQFNHDDILIFLNQKLDTMGKDFTELFVLDLEGIIHVSTTKGNERKIKTNEQYFINGKNTSFVQNFYYDLTLQEPSMLISTPIIDKNQNTIGVLVGRINLEEISNIMSQREGLGETGETYLVNKFNYLVTKSRFIERIEFKKTIHTQAVKECLKEKEGNGKYKDYRDVQVIGSYKWINERDICLIAEFDQDEALQPIKSLRNIIILVSLTVIILALIIGYIFSKALTRSITKLREFSHEIGKGNLNTKTKINSKDEIGELASSFENMATELKKTRKKLKIYNKTLEKKVNERTKALESKNLELEQFNNIAVGREVKMVELKKKIKELEDRLKQKE